MLASPLFLSEDWGIVLSFWVSSDSVIMTTLSYCLAVSAETPLAFAVTASGLVVESF